MEFANGDRAESARKVRRCMGVRRCRVGQASAKSHHKATSASWWDFADARPTLQGTDSRLIVLALLFGERADALAEQGDVERLLESLAEAVVGQLLRVRLVFAG